MNAIQFHMKRLGACKAMLKWARTQANPKETFARCPRGDWLLFLVRKLGVEKRAITLAACSCARLALPFAQDSQPIQTILLTEHWALGDTDILIESVRKAAIDCDEVVSNSKTGANAAYAAMFAAITALPGRIPEGAAETAAEAVAEAAAVAEIGALESRAARVAMRRACAKAVLSKVGLTVVMELWRKHVTQSSLEGCYARAHNRSA